MACVATWSFGVEAVERASLQLKAGDCCVDALEKAINGMMFVMLLTLYLFFSKLAKI